MRALFTTLPESSPAGCRRRRTPSGLVVSVALHGAAIALAVVATAGPGRTSQASPDDEHHFIWVPQEVPPSPPSTDAGPARRASVGAPRRADRATPGPISHPIDFDPSTLPAIETPPGGAIGEPWDTPTEAPGTSSADAGPIVGNPVLGGRQVEVEAALLRGATPRYPAMLRDAGTEGRVTLRFVVDTSGRVESASVRVVASTDELFATAARATLPTLRFSPARAGGRPVRQLVELPFEFRMGR